MPARLATLAGVLATVAGCGRAAQRAIDPLTVLTRKGGSRKD
jgi:hypothetical protein